MSTDELKLQSDQTIRQLDVLAWLENAHYALVEQVTFFGQYMRLGDVITIYPINHTLPVTVTFFGNTIESLAYTNATKQTLSRISVESNIVDADGSVFEPGQYVVHLDHGIGQFRTLGMRETKPFADKTISPLRPAYSSEPEWAPYLILDYAHGAELFVPPDQAHKLTHYIGSRAPVLSSLGSAKWQRTKKCVEESLFKLARELITIAAKREVHPRPPLPVNLEWLNQIAAEFPYEPTDDQYQAILATLVDLSKPKPMDRLICGDVGFGKTEVALRAAAAVVSSGKQVAVLVPTTLLAEQHRATFSTRFAGLPVRVEGLSRFVAKEKQQSIIDDLNQGRIDLVIGTHRLLQPDVGFADLGLIIIDEEQKFGVRHKEHLKKLRAEVDILTLSATPIPRTLFLGLSGLREISVIATPPHNRLPIKTIVQRRDDAVVHQAITDELNRGGQVFVLHNDVMTLPVRVALLKKALPDATIAMAHGQMAEGQLAHTFAAMIEKKIDVLVTSTIIESGLDMPNVNTLVVDKADHFGLSDMYQLRGRVGRSDRQAYAYFLYDVPELSPIAQARFKALVESESLGSGYGVALRDLEIRGGGNVLGKEQHGNMEAVGLSLYSKLLEQTVKKLQVKKKPSFKEVFLY